ncbi:MAG: winged helix-turn-helix transcriptional regulator [Ruminococcaceae bacterium]|nr:winged helix-turn-helix transcriptional regulator [Oscillospiraceae bacterium]
MQVERLVPAKESLTVEFKSDKKAISDEVIIDAVVAFANTEGGELFLGVEDDGKITGIHPSHRDITQLAAFIANKTIPPQSVRVELLDEAYPVIRIQVAKSFSIVASSSGKTQRRQIKADGTPENVPMYPYEYNTRLSGLSLLDYSVLPVPNASYDDLDPVQREHLRNILRSYNGEKTLLELGDEELDKALRLVTTVNDRLVPTFTGMLLIGRQEKILQYIPTAEAAYIAFAGTEITVNQTFYLPLLSALERIFEFVDARNSEREMTAGLFRLTIPDFDRRAVREAIINAFVHRDYTRMGRVIVQLDDDGLSITNPGGFIDGVTIDNILTVEPHGRNPALADALKRIGMAERSGRGVDRIFEGSLLYGRPLPDYSETSSTAVRLFIPRGVPDENFIRMVSEQQQRRGTLLPFNTLLILNELKQFRRMSISEISEATHISEAKTRATVERMAEAGLLEPTGSGKSRAYILSAKAYQDKAAYVRQTDIEAVRYPELVLKLADAKKTITRKDVIELLHVTPPQAYRILQKLEERGELIREGTTRNTTYHRKG